MEDSLGLKLSDIGDVVWVKNNHVLGKFNSNHLKDISIHKIR